MNQQSSRATWLQSMPAAGGKYRPVTPQRLAEVACLLGASAAASLADVLALPSSPCVGGRSCEFLLNANGVVETLESFPEWRVAGFVPIGGDGCGNYFVVHVSSAFGSPVLFVEPMSSTAEPTYIVASDTEHFMEAIVNNGSWFDQEHVRRADPQLTRFVQYPYPWQA